MGYDKHKVRTAEVPVAGDRWKDRTNRRLSIADDEAVARSISSEKTKLLTYAQVLLGVRPGAFDTVLARHAVKRVKVYLREFSQDVNRNFN